MMKQKVTRREQSLVKPSAAAVSLQEELVAAIHGAFEVAVEIAVREVKKLVNQTSNDTYEELRRENESLKRRLKRTEAELDCVRLEKSHDESPQSFTNNTHVDSDQTCCDQIGPYPDVSPMHSCTEVRDDTPDPQHELLMSRDEEQNLIQDHDATSQAKTAEIQGCNSKDVAQKISNACVLSGQGLNPSCRDPESQECDPPPFPTKSTMKQISVKQEKIDEARDRSSCCLESIKLEEFSLDCMSAVQSKMFEEWKPEVPDIQSQDSNYQLSSAEFEQADSPDPTTSIQLPSDIPSLSSEFPNIFHVPEPAPVPEPPPQAFGVNIRGSRSLNNPSYSCKICGQGFHLPSLLRRHYGQCQQRFQYRSQQPMAGGKRTRLQLYPPGCSPFRCTVCNREFNRLENLKTHLRIHTGERPYTCAVCAKCFRHSGALTRHFRIHTGEKPYVCDECGKSFRNCGGLKFHQRSHNKQLQ